MKKTPQLYERKLTQAEEIIIDSLRCLNERTQADFFQRITDAAKRQQELETAALFAKGKKKQLQRRMKCRGLTVIDGGKMPKRKKAQEPPARCRYVDIDLFSLGEGPEGRL